MSAVALLSEALHGCTIVIAADRRATDLAAALERHGASVVKAPALMIEPHIDDNALLARTRELITNPPDVVIATTGVGFRGWMEAAVEADLFGPLADVLSRCRIIARGPKARGAIQQAGFAADWVAESETSHELGEYLTACGVAGRRIAIQHHGSGADGLDELFISHGADVVSMTVYRWAPPPDPSVVDRAVERTSGGEVDAVVFTSAPGAAQWLSDAERAGHLSEIRTRARTGRLALAVVGPVTAGPLHERSMPVLQADRGRLGSLVRRVVTHFGTGQAPVHNTEAGPLSMRSGGVWLGDRFVPLTPMSVKLLGALFDAAGSVVSRRDLLEATPGPARSAHAIEMSIARLRESVGPGVVQTVVKRGYRLQVTVPSSTSATPEG